MNNWIVTLIVLAILAMLIVIAVRKRLLTRPRRGAFTGMVVYHDWSNRDTQHGTEEIIKWNAGTRESEDKSGESKDRDDLQSAEKEP